MISDLTAESHWHARLAEFAARRVVPGAALGILRAAGTDNETMTLASYGVLNRETGVETTTDSLFQLGSMTKVWTATLVMQLVDEGLLGLDQPVAEVLPELRLVDEEANQLVTMSHLLTHTSGIDGDVFTNTGRGDDCLERYVALLAEVPQLHPVGATWSYCNSGFVVAGRVVERLTGQTWDAALRDRLFTPLGLTHTVTLPEEALLFRAAVGHVGPPGEAPRRASTWGPVRSLGPAGLVTSSPRDVLAFARLHLNGGRTPDGESLLSEASVSAMQSRQADLPGVYNLGDSCGLSWFRSDWGGHRVIGHDGDTIGQSSFLRMLPDQGLAVTLLTNGGDTKGLYEDLFREIFDEIAGVTMPQRAQPSEHPPVQDLGSYQGSYQRNGVRADVTERSGGLLMRLATTLSLNGAAPGEADERAVDLELTPVQPGQFVMRMQPTEPWTTVTFYRLANGAPYLHFGLRTIPKVL